MDTVVGIGRDRYDKAPCFETVVDVVGLEHGTSGRTCERHGVCGDTVEIGAVLLLEHMIISKICLCKPIGIMCWLICSLRAE